MSKTLSNASLVGEKPLPPTFRINGHQHHVYGPRISFAIRSLATNPTALMFYHQDALARVLNTPRTSRGVRNPFRYLVETKHIASMSVPLFRNSAFVILRLAPKGEELASQLGYDKTSNDWERIKFNRSVDGPGYLAKVTQIAYQFRMRGIKVKVAPWNAKTSNPPDLLIGEEEHWAYATGSQILTQKGLSQLASAAEAANKPLALITNGENSRNKMAVSCTKLGISVKFAELQYLFRATRNYYKGLDEEEFTKLWLLKI